MVRQYFVIHLYWTCCLCYNCGSKHHLVAGAPNARNKNFRGSTGTKRNNGSSQRLPVAKGGMTRKKEDKWNSQKATTEPSSLPPSSPTEAPSAPPNTPLINQSILKPDTSNPTIVPISSPPTSENNVNVDSLEDGKETDGNTMVELLPFSLVIDGSIEDEFYIREELQYYLLDYYWEQEEPEFIDSIKLEIVSYMLLLNGKEPNRNLQQQLPQTPSTVTTFLEYEGRAIIKRSKQEETVDVRSQNDIGTIQDIQIKSLENTAELQEHFLKWFTLQHIVAGERDKYPVVLKEVQVDDRPPKHVDSKETWQTVESILDDDPNVSSANQNNNASDGDERDIDDEIDINIKNNKTQQKTPTTSNTPDQIVNASSSNNDSNTWKVTVSIGCVMMILAGIGVMFFIWRETRHRYHGLFVKGKLSRELDNHAVEVRSDVDSDEHMESILYEKSILRSDSDESKEKLLFFLPNFLMFRKTTQAIKIPVTENEYNVDINDTTANNVSSSNSISFVSRKHEIPSLATSQSTMIDLTVPVRNSKGCEDDIIDKKISDERQRGNSGHRSSFTFSPISFLHQKSSKSVVDNITPKDGRSVALQHDPDETDLIVRKMNINTVTSNDDDSMMGYSLASHEGESVIDRSKSHQDVNKEYSNDGHHEGIVKKYRSDESHNSESDISISRYNESNTQTSNFFRNPLFAGINKFLDVPNHSNNSRLDANRKPPKNKSKHQDQQDRSEGFVGNDKILAVKPSSNIISGRKDEDVQLVTTMLNIHKVDDETVSSYKEDGPTKGEISSVVSEFSSAGMSDNDLKCHDMLTKHTSATPLEEIRGGSFLLPMRERKPIFSSTLVDALTLDDVSDAPSDERNSGRLASRILSSKAITNSCLLDNDPTLIDHLAKEQRDVTKIRTKKRR